MSYIKSTVVGLLILVSLFLMACQSNNSDVGLSSSDSIHKLSIVDANRSITAANQTEVFNLYVANTSTNSPVAGESISLDFFNGSLGTVTSFKAITDETGRAVFNYTAPNSLADFNGTVLTFKMDSNHLESVSSVLSVDSRRFMLERPTLVLEPSTLNITKNGEVATININVYDRDFTPFSDGNIKIRYPSEVLNGKNVGSFNVATAAIVDGKASFIYTAPNPLNGDDSIVFSFYHDSSPELIVSDLNISIVPDAGQVVLTNYTLEATYETSMSLETTRSMSFSIRDEDANGVSDSDVVLMRVSSLNPSLGRLEDSSGNKGTSLTVRGKGNVQMNIVSNTISGVIPIEVYAEFRDANGNLKSLTRVFNVVVLAGPPTAISLSYAGTSQKAEYAKFVEDWVLTVTDKYNNLVSSNPSVSMGALVGYAQSSAPTSNVANYLYYNSSSESGTLRDSNPDTFTATFGAFNNVDLVNDKLVLFGGSGYRFNAYGKWDIANKATSNSLMLMDDYSGEDVTNLGFAVGNNFRNEVCSGNPVVANVYAKDGDNILGSTGSMIIQVEYDYYLVGKDVVLWANLVGSSSGEDVRIGLGRKITLRGMGIDNVEFNFAAGQTGTRRFFLSTSNTVEWYKNGNFSWNKFEVSGDGNAAHISGTSMNSGITSCADGGRAYIDVDITSAAQEGTISISGILPSSEF